MIYVPTIHIHTTIYHTICVNTAIFKCKTVAKNNDSRKLYKQCIYAYLSYTKTTRLRLHPKEYMNLNCVANGRLSNIGLRVQVLPCHPSTLFTTDHVFDM